MKLASSAVRVIPIAGHGHRALDPKLSVGAVGHVIALPVNDTDVGAGHGDTDTVRAFGAETHRQDRYSRGKLGRAIGIHQAEVRQLFRQFTDGGLRHRCAAVAPDPPVLQVVVLDIAAQQKEVVHRRHHQRLRDFFICG